MEKKIIGILFEYEGFWSRGLTETATSQNLSLGVNSVWGEKTMKVVKKIQDAGPGS